jgi:hypothetical protein
MLFLIELKLTATSLFACAKEAADHDDHGIHLPARADQHVHDLCRHGKKLFCVRENVRFGLTAPVESDNPKSFHL